MKPSEKLILMLELNNYNIDSLFLKKQIDSEKTGNIELHNSNNFSDLIICNYLFEEDKDYTSRNPLSYRVGTSEEVDSLDQFVIKHPDVGKQLSIKDFLSIEIFSDTEKRNILTDVIHKWLDEYKEARSVSSKNLQELFFNITGDNSKYRKPSKIIFIIGFVFAIFTTILIVRPQALQHDIFSSFSNFVDDWSQLLHDTFLYSVFGVFTILLFILYACQYYAVLYRIRGIMKEKTSKVIRRIYKRDTEMNKTISKQSRVLEKYVDLVIKKPERSKLQIKKLNSLETLLNKYRVYVKKVERKYYLMIKNHSKKMKRLRATYISYILLNLAFIGFAYVIIRGLINV